MSDFDPRYHRSPKVTSPDLDVADFEPEVFKTLEKADPIPDPNEDFDKDAPPRPPAPNPFEEFTVDRKPLSGLMADLPSLEGLFKPFDLTSGNPAPPQEYEDLRNFTAPTEFVYEDMDTRDPSVVRTLAQAEAKRDEIIRAAEEQASRIIARAETEARGLAAEAQAQEQLALDESRKEVEKINQAALDFRAASEEDRAAAAEELEAARSAHAEADAMLAAAAERIAGLDQERQTMEEEMAARRAELENEFNAKNAEFEAARQGLEEAARTSGHQEGHERGLAEGRAAGRQEASAVFQKQVAGLVEIMEKMEGIYNDLWAANSPMMIKLAIEAAEQILNKELAEARDLAAHAFGACIDFLSQAHQVTFLARPQDIAQLEAAKAEQRERLGALVKVTFQPDETLGPGDLIVESDVGRLDATIKHRTAQVLKVLREAFAGAYDGAGADDGPSPPSAENDEADIIDIEAVPAEPEASAAEPEAPPVETEPAETPAPAPETPPDETPLKDQE